MSKVAEVRNTAPKDAVQRVLDDKKMSKDRLCEELEERKKARKRRVRWPRSEGGERGGGGGHSGRVRRRSLRWSHVRTHPLYMLYTAHSLPSFLGVSCFSVSDETPHAFGALYNPLTSSFIRFGIKTSYCITRLCYTSYLTIQYRWYLSVPRAQCLYGKRGAYFRCRIERLDAVMLPS